MRTRMRAFNSGPMGSSAARFCAASTSPTGAALSCATGIDIVLVRLPAHLRSGAVPHSPTPSLVEPGFAELERGIDWRRVWGAVRRFKWLILSVTVLGTAAGVVAARFAKPEYLAQATIWIDQADREENRRDADRGPIRSGHPLEPEAGVGLPQSHVLLHHA